MNKRCKTILKAFKEANPDLVALSPKITVAEILESFSSDSPDHIYYDPPLQQISVTHPFIFDNRLVPAEFQGIQVQNITLCITIPSKEFPDLGIDNEPIEEHEAPERYIAFVKRKLSVIRKKLKRPDLSEEEALDAITGDFNAHVEWCNQSSKKRLAENHSL